MESVASIDSCVVAAAELPENGALGIVRESRIDTVVGRLSEERFDVVFYDLCLEGAENLKGLARIVSACADTPVVVLCDRHDAAAEEALRHGAQGYLVKGSDALRTLR